MRKIILLSALLIALNLPALAENIPVKITPDQLVSTCYNEIEIGDPIRFKAVNDVYVNEKLYISKGSTIIGIVDYVSENGWFFDNAQIDFKEFKFKNVNNKQVTIKSPMAINGFELLKDKGKRKAQFFNYCGLLLFRGKEIEIIPAQDYIEFVIWVDSTKL